MPPGAVSFHKSLYLSEVLTRISRETCSRRVSRRRVLVAAVDLLLLGINEENVITL
jgi:hypothetical protein